MCVRCGECAGMCFAMRRTDTTINSCLREWSARLFYTFCEIEKERNWKVEEWGGFLYDGMWSVVVDVMVFTIRAPFYCHTRMVPLCGFEIFHPTNQNTSAQEQITIFIQSMCFVKSQATPNRHHPADWISQPPLGLTTHRVG